MCNDYANRVGYREIVHAFSQIRIPLVSPGPESAPNLEPRDDIRPTELAPIVRAASGGVELTQMRWGFVSKRMLANGRAAPPVINFRSEGRRFETGRCLIPASAFYEFTGTRYPKTKWRVTVQGLDWFCIAGLWRADPEGERFTMLTTAPGPDMAPYHDRQVIPLGPYDWPEWLNGAEPEALLRPSPSGFLNVERATPAAGQGPDLFAPR